MQDSTSGSVLAKSSPSPTASARTFSSYRFNPKSKSSVNAIPNTMEAASGIFSGNVSKIKQDIPLPKVGEDIETTAQLVACAEILARTAPGTSSESSSKSTTMDDLTPSQVAWMQDMTNRPLEKDYIRQLMNRMVDRFLTLPNKTSDVIQEIVLLGPLLDKEYYRALLDRFLNELNSEIALNTHLLQGLVTLVESAQSAPPFHLPADDLTKILRIIRKHLEDPAQQETLYTVYLTTAISKVLVIMVACGVKDLNREDEHEPLLKILAKLRKHADPSVRYQVEYAYRALQLVPNDETLRQGFTRNAINFAGGLMTVASVIQLDFGGVREGFPVLIKSGKGLVDNLKKYFGISDNNPWFQSVCEAELMVNEGRLVDFNRLICEVECCQDPLFQWGVCLILGKIAVDPSWDTSSHYQAVKLLGAMFKSCSGSDRHQDVRSCILALLLSISELPTTDPSIDTDIDAIRRQALSTIIELEGIGNEKVLPLQPSHVAMNPRPLPTLSKLLKEIDGNFDLGFVLDRLRYQQQDLYSRHDVYISPMSKQSVNASDENPDPLHGRVHRFLKGDGLVMLILGDSGAGKSTFNARLEQDLWDSYRAGDPIPLLIDLKVIRDLGGDLIQQHLDSLNVFSASHMGELRSQEFILICDGYDESQCRFNLYTTNQFNRPRQWRAKMVISCRTQYLTSGYQISFAPQQETVAHLGLSPNKLFAEAVIVPFKPDQIKEYIAQYTAVPDTIDDKPKWTAAQYKERLEAIPNAMDLIKNPFMLKMILDALPEMSSTIAQITRVELYDEFVHLHFKYELVRLKNQLSGGKMEHDRLAVFREMERLDFSECGIDFSKQLAEAIFNEGQGVNSVEYWSVADSESWKRQFFGPEPKTQMLMEASQLIRRNGSLDSHAQIRGRRRSTGSRDSYRFSHFSILEYFYALSIYDPKNDLPRLDPAGSPPLMGTRHYLSDHPLGRRSLVNKPAILQFLADRVQYIDDFRDHLHTLVRLSKDHGSEMSVSCAAANAITILIRAGEQFNGADLRGIRIPGADLSCGDFDSAQLQGADLRNTTLRNVWMHQADLSNSRMEGVVFGEYPYLEVGEGVRHCTFSLDGKYLAVGLSNGTIVVYCTSSWTKVYFPKLAVGVNSVSPSGNQTSSGNDGAVQLDDTEISALDSSLHGHTDSVLSVAFSPNGHQIASGSGDMTVRLWDTQTGAFISSFTDHTRPVSSVAFSHDGRQVASGSHDMTVRLWNAQTGALDSSLSGHTDAITSVAFSPCGLRIASGSHDETVRICDSKSGALTTSLKGHTNTVTSIAFSPNGLQIASGGWDKTVRLWDAQTGTLISSLSGHAGDVNTVAFSPKGHQIASGSGDKTVRLWDTQTGAFTSSMSGHTRAVNSVAFSPNGYHIASGGWDKTVRLWDARTDAVASSTNGHTKGVASVAFSPNGHQIVSGGNDETVRLWDTQTGAFIKSLKGHTNGISSVAFSPSGHQIASGSYDRTVRLWDVENGTLVSSLSGHTNRVNSVAFSPSGHQVASGSADNTVRVWDTQTGDHVYSLSGHTDEIESVVFSPSGHQIASGSDDKTVGLWDTQTGILVSYLSGHTGKVTSVAFSPRGCQIASGSMDKTVRLWDAQTGAFTFSLSGHSRWITFVVYSPNGHQIASGSDDDSVRLWDLESGQCLLTFGGFDDVAFGIDWRETPNGSYLAVGGSAKSVRAWKIIEDENQLQVCLHWRSNPDTLILGKASIRGVQDLSNMNLRLMQQRQAIGQPIAL